MRVLVTGGAGFIGSQVARALARDGHDVLVLDRVEPAELGLPSVTGDIRDRDVVSGALQGVDAVVHQAAKVGMGVGADDLPAYVGDNDLATAVLLAAMAQAGITRLVLASSMVVYGEGGYACAAHGPVRPGPRGIADLVEGRFEPLCDECSQPLAPGLVDEDARRTRAASTRPRRSRRSTWPPRGRGSPTAGSSRCATTTCMGRGCHATRPTPALRRSSARRSSGASRRGCSRTAVSAATSSTWTTWPWQTWRRSQPLTPRSRGFGRTTFHPASRSRSARWPLRSPPLLAGRSQ